MVITSSGRKTGHYTSASTAAFEQQTFAAVANLSAIVSYNDAFVYALVQHGAEAVAKSGALNKPRAVTATQTPQFSNYSDAVKSANVRVNYEATPRTAGIADVQQGIRIPGNKGEVFEALYIMAAHTNTNCEFETYPERVAGFSTAVGRVGLSAAVEEVRNQYPLNHHDTVSLTLSRTIFETGRQSTTSHAL